MVNNALASLDAGFEALYADFRRPSIAPERLIRAGLIQIQVSVRSERQRVEHRQYNLLFRWFVGPGINDPVRVPAIFTSNRGRLLTTGMSGKTVAAVLVHREVAPLLPDGDAEGPVRAGRSEPSPGPFDPGIAGFRGDLTPGRPDVRHRTCFFGSPADRPVRFRAPRNALHDRPDPPLRSLEAPVLGRDR